MAKINKAQQFLRMHASDHHLLGEAARVQGVGHTVCGTAEQQNELRRQRKEILALQQEQGRLLEDNFEQMQFFELLRQMNDAQTDNADDTPPTSSATPPSAPSTSAHTADNAGPSHEYTSGGVRLGGSMQREQSQSRLLEKFKLAQEKVKRDKQKKSEN